MNDPFGAVTAKYGWSNTAIDDEPGMIGVLHHDEARLGEGQIRRDHLLVQAEQHARARSRLTAGEEVQVLAKRDVREDVHRAAHHSGLDARHETAAIDLELEPSLERERFAATNVIEPDDGAAEPTPLPGHRLVWNRRTARGAVAAGRDGSAGLQRGRRRNRPGDRSPGNRLRVDDVTRRRARRSRPRAEGSVH